MLRFHMGIDSAEIICIGDTLWERHPDRFTDDFETNQRQVLQLTDVESKRVRKRIAGYLTRRARESATDRRSDSQEQTRIQI